MDKKAFGKRINQARKDRGLTAEKLAEACHINATYLRQIEGGTKTPSLPVFIDICNALKVSPAFLLKDMLSSDNNMEEVSSLWENATPSQIEMVMSMIKAALEHTEAD